LKLKKIQYYLLTKSIGLYLNGLSYIAPNKATQKAYQLFSQPRKGRLKHGELPEVLKDATQTTLEFQHHKIQTYHWKGNEKVILLVHGWESNASRWKKLLEHLKQTPYTIIAVDAPAHGLSSGNEFNAILYSEFINVVAQKHNPNAIIGHSVGGMASLYYQSKFQNPNLEKLVLLGAPSDLEVIFNNYIKMLSLNSRIQKNLEKHFIQKFNLQLKDFSGSHFGKKINSKGIIAHDLKDKVVLFSESEKIASSWQQAKFIKTKGYGHSLHKTALYQEIIAFLGA
jgi:esterase/lipase